MKCTLVCTDEQSNKFWTIEVNGSSYTVQFGKVDTTRQTQTKEFADEATCLKAAQKLIAEKSRKGYVDIEDHAISEREEESLPENIKELRQKFEKVIIGIQNYDKNSDYDFYSKLIKSAFQSEEIISEGDLINIAADHPELKSSIYKLFDAIMNTFDKKGVFWENDEVQAGQHIAGIYASNNFKDVGMLTKFIDKCDIDHEVELSDTIQYVWNKWGFTKETLHMIVRYLNRSQHGDELICTLCESDTHNLAKIMETTANANLFLSELKKAFDKEGSSFDSEFAEDMLMEVFESIFVLEEEDAMQMAEDFIEIYEDERTPKASIIPKKKPDLPQGSEEQFLQEVIAALTELEKEVRAGYETIADELEKAPHVQTAGAMRVFRIHIEGKKRNKLVYRTTTDRIQVGKQVHATMKERKFTSYDYSALPETFFENEFLNAINKWLQPLIDKEYKGGFYDAEVYVYMWIEAPKGLSTQLSLTLVSKQRVAEWNEYMREVINSKAFESWGRPDFEWGVNFHSIFNIAESLDPDLLIGFLEKEKLSSNRYFLDEKYIGAYCKRIMEKDNLSGQEINDFGKILKVANRIFFQSFPLYSEAIDFAVKKGYKE